jgi:hypothetical protein
MLFAEGEGAVRFTLLVGASLATLLAAPLHAQNDKELVMRVAALFVKAKLAPGRPIILDFKGIPSDSNIGDSTARELGARRGRADTSVSCSVIPGNRPERRCRVSGDGVIVDVALAFVHGDTANTHVSYTESTERGGVYLKTYWLLFTRDEKRIWRVAKILGVGAS